MTGYAQSKILASSVSGALTQAAGDRCEIYSRTLIGAMSTEMSQSQTQSCQTVDPKGFDTHDWKDKE